ncbi:MAG: WG repeat-containing protein, partial [Pyrinomonadaceae bacterium]|nr:WG repeat-containing protein [Pyrinomonadaceae bacterium]
MAVRSASNFEGIDMQRVFFLLVLTLILLPPVSAQLFFEDDIRLFPFVAEGKWGFIDKAGKVEIEPAYRSVSGYSEGFAVVELDDGRMSMIDSNGEIAFEPMEIRIFSMSEGLSRAQKGDFWGYIDSKGKVVIPFKYELASNFFKGVARIKIERKFAFIDRRGNVLTKLY